MAQTEEGYIRRLVGAGTAGEILVNALQLKRLAGGRLPDHSFDDLRVAIAIQHLHAGHFLILVRAAGEIDSVQSGGVRISVESASVKCHIRAGCPHPAAQGRRIPTPVTAGHTGPALQGATVIQGGQRFAALQKGREISKMWENARKLLPGMGDLGENAEIGVDKWEECGIICISAGVLLLWRFNEIKTKCPAEILTKRGRKQ